MTTPTAAVIGQLARDLVLSVTDLPEAGASAGATVGHMGGRPDLAGTDARG